jgi:hypothetical protein
MIELNGLDEIADWLDQRELYMGATMIRRDKDAVDGPGASTYLAMALADDVGGRFGIKPQVTGSQPIAPALPASGPWAGGDPCGDELPLGFSIEELPALGGASEPLRSSVEIEAPAQVSGADSGKR